MANGNLEIDTGDSGLARGLRERELNSRIKVPFCPESKLSGVEYLDFMEAVWYRREVKIPEDWQDRYVLLHFQAVDYEATVWVNGRGSLRHRGGFSFTCDLQAGSELGDTAVIVVRARDPRDWHKPGGKQSVIYENAGCHYPRTTGIWQTVWMEPVPPTRLKRPASHHAWKAACSGWSKPYLTRAWLDYYSGAERRPRRSLAGNRCHRNKILRPSCNCRFLKTASASGSLATASSMILTSPSLTRPALLLTALEVTPACAALAIDGYKILINGVSVFQRLVLDRGYYPDGLLTAPSDESLMRDISKSMQAGFNGARLHQKVFEERFLYHADILGYLVWGEYGDWGFRDRSGRVPTTVVDGYRHQPGAALLAQWMEVLERDYSHPSIIGWCPLNETS